MTANLSAIHGAKTGLPWKRSARITFLSEDGRSRGRNRHLELACRQLSARRQPRTTRGGYPRTDMGEGWDDISAKRTPIRSCYARRNSTGRKGRTRSSVRPGKATEAAIGYRSEGRRVGKECVSKG